MTCKACVNSDMHAVCLSGRYYSFTKVCFAGLYFGFLKKSSRSKTPKNSF